jgi:hypothetical protein
MQARCPNPQCGKETSQGTNYAKFLELAEAGTLTFLCVYCDTTWTPSPAEQKVYAANLRNLLAHA